MKPATYRRILLELSLVTFDIEKFRTLQTLLAVYTSKFNPDHLRLSDINESNEMIWSFSAVLAGTE